MDDLRDLMRDAVTADAAVTTGGELAAAMGGTVRSRVRRRRAARAAGVGSLAAVSVGAVAFGAVRLPGAVSAPMGAGDCTPGTVAVSGAPASGGVTPTAHPIDVSSDRESETWLLYDDVREEVALEVTEVREGVIEVTEAGGEPYRPQQRATGDYVFESPSGGWVIYSPGADPALDWTLEVPVMVQDDGERYQLSSATGATVTVFVEDGQLFVNEPGGFSGLRARDGVYSVPLSDGSEVSVEVDAESGGIVVMSTPDVGTMSIADHAELSFATPTATPQPTVTCITPEPTATATPRPTREPSADPSASVSPTPAPTAEPSAEADPATASSPYQCGFEFPEPERGSEQWGITRVAWLSADETVRQLRDSFGDVDAVWDDEVPSRVLRIDVDGTLLTGDVPGESGTFEPGASGSQLSRHAPFESTSISVVAVQRGEVVATIDPKYPERQKGLIADRDEPGAAAHAWLFDLRDLTDCPGEDADGFDLYAVSAAAAVAPDGTVTGPFYAWKLVEGP